MSAYFGTSGFYTSCVERWELWKRTRRKHHFRRLGLNLGENVTFYGPLSITWPQNVSIGRECTLNEGVHLGGRGGIRIGNHCRISARVFLESGYLETNGVREDGFPKRRHAHAGIQLGDHVWVGAGAMILAGVNIGNGAVVAAGAVVTRDVPAGSFAKGVPATCTSPTADSPSNHEVSS